MKSLLRIALALTFACIMPLTLHAETVKLTATLAPATNVNSNGNGNLTATLDTSTRKLTYEVTYTGLSGPATAAHFHGPADPGQDAGPQVPVKGSVASPIKGSATLTEQQMNDLLAGKYYFNVHTKANPKGEIRGQVMKS
jgi:hypothetical protein